MAVVGTYYRTGTNFRGRLNFVVFEGTSESVNTVISPAEIYNGQAFHIARLHSTLLGIIFVWLRMCALALGNESAKKPSKI